MLTPLAPGAPDVRPRFLSEADCHDIAQRVAQAARGGGYTVVQIQSTWRGNVRWARNQVSTSGEDRDARVQVMRNVHGAGIMGVTVNAVTDEALGAAVRRCEAIVQRQSPEWPESDLATYYHPEPFSAPQLFFDATYQLDAKRRAAAARALMRSATDAGMLSAGYVEVSAHSQAFIGSWGYTRYCQYTWAQYSVTVRDPKGTGSGWAGVDWPDWNRIDGEKLSAIALEKCLKSRNPVAIEPGRYTTILEPQAVCDLVSVLVQWSLLRSTDSRMHGNENDTEAPFNKKKGVSRLGERVVDERITIRADPLDPDLGFPPFRNGRYPMDHNGILDPTEDEFYHPATWIERGILTQLWYGRPYAIEELGRPTGLYNSGAFRMSGGDTSVAEMVATTKRGLLVTRFDGVEEIDGTSVLCRGYTRDGLWLIENGAITKPVMNLMFVESILFALNNVEQLGPPQRAFHPMSSLDFYDLPAPVIVPPLKIRDFSFTALSGAI